MSIRESLKKFTVLKKKVRWLRSSWESLKPTPDILEKGSQAFFLATHRRTLESPTVRETRLTEKLRAHMGRLPVELPTASTPGPAALWMQYRHDLRTKVLSEDPRDFKKWWVVAFTMGGNIRRKEFNKLAQLPFWPEWSEAIAALKSPYQEPYYKLPATDGTTLLHAYHLAQFKIYCDKEVRDVNFIVDFGSGYGSMCALAYTLGFKGEYVLFDSPEFLLLQEFYLKLHGIDTSKIKFVSTLSELEQVVGRRRGLLIGTWSVSETPVEFREKFFTIFNPTDYLIGYQRRVMGVDNNAYFQTFAQRRPDISWHDFPIPNRTDSGNRYLLGTLRH